MARIHGPSVLAPEEFAELDELWNHNLTAI